MASIDPSLISDPREKTWVGEISEILKHQLEIKVEIFPPVSIFQIPETITKNKPEAYEPQHIGFGPNHHFRTGPYSKMEQKKLVAVQRVLEDHKIKDFRLTVLDKVQTLIPVIRASYQMFLQEDNLFLAWVLAIDGLFLLNLFHNYDSQLSLVEKRLLAQDLMMVENQIPYMLLKKIDEALHSSSGNKFSPSIFRSFSAIHSPLELCSPLPGPNHVEHLLHYMYHSIINNLPEPSPSPVSPIWSPTMPYFNPSLQNSVTDSVTNSISHVSNILKKVPQKEIAQLYEQTIITLKNFSKKKFTVPSASKLQCRAGFRFHCLPKNEGIRNIDIDGKNFHLPRVTLNNDSEVILRNLVAYEKLKPNSSNQFPLTEYMGLMCGLIVSVDDVRLLKRANIIISNLGDDKVAKIFFGMSSSVMSLKHKEKSELQEMIDKANKVYESRPMIKAHLFMKKLANWLLVGLIAIGSFVGATWKIVAFMVSILTLLMLLYQPYCEVYGCDKTNIALLSHASS